VDAQKNTMRYAEKDEVRPERSSPSIARNLSQREKKMGGKIEWEIWEKNRKRKKKTSTTKEWRRKQAEKKSIANEWNKKSEIVPTLLPLFKTQGGDISMTKKRWADEVKFSCTQSGTRDSRGGNWEKGGVSTN